MESPSCKFFVRGPLCVFLPILFPIRQRRHGDKAKAEIKKAEIRHELHELTRIDSMACQKNRLVTISEIRVKGFMPVARTVPGIRISTPVHNQPERQVKSSWPCFFTTSASRRMSPRWSVCRSFLLSA